MDRDAPTLGDVAHDGVAGYGLAALRVADHQAVDALNLDAATETQPLDDASEGRGLGRLQLVGRKIGIQRPHHRPERDVASPNRGLELLGAPDRERGRGGAQAGVVRGIEPPPAHFAREDLLAELEALLELFLANPLPDLVP